MSPERERATAALRAVLAGGPVRATEAGEIMRDAGFSDGQTRRARASLGVLINRHGAGNGSWWEWELPSDGVCPTCGRPMADVAEPADMYDDLPRPSRPATVDEATSTATRVGPGTCSVCGRQTFRIGQRCGLPADRGVCPGVIR